MKHQQAGQRQFAGFRQLGLAVGVHQHQGVVVAAEGGWAQVADDQWHGLAHQLLARMLHQIVALGGETHAPRPLTGRQPRHGCQDVGVLGQLEYRRGLLATLLDLVVVEAGRPPVGHGRGGDEDVVLHRCRQHGVGHLLRAQHVDALHVARRRQVHGAGHQGDGRAGLLGRAREGETHLAAGQVGQATHRVDGLEGGPGRDQHAPARQALRLERGDELVAQCLGLQHAAVASLAAGLVAGVGAQHHRTVGAQLRHVALGGRVRPHLAVHRRRHQQRHTLGGPGQAQQRQQVVGTALHQLRDEVGAGRRDQDGVGLAREVDVRHVVGGAVIPLVGVDGVIGQRLHRHRGDEAAG